MQTPNLKDILERYNNGTCSEEEKALIESWYAHIDLNVPHLSENQLKELRNLPAPYHKHKVLYLKHWASIAAIFLCIAVSGLLYWNSQSNNNITSTIVQNDVLPGSNKAILQLSNGKKIILSEHETGELAIENGVKIHKDRDDKIVYEDISRYKNNSINSNNTISTPRGGTYRLILSDGTKVWLNASSSISYPVQFDKNKRVVEITGEVYFEVSTNKEAPFFVKSQQQTVQVLGTHFNINAYTDQPEVRTTLAEGSVKVILGTTNKILKPGQQAITSSQQIQIKAVDIYSELAWKNGDFVFNNSSIKDIMQQLSRWYDIDVDYSTYTERNETFSGEISRSRNLSAVIHMLENTNSIRFRIEGKRLLIINN